MAITLTFDPAAETRAAAALRLNLRDALADMLGRVVPRHMTVLDDGEDFGAEAELFPTDAREAARDLIEEMEAQGFAIGRAHA